MKISIKILSEQVYKVVRNREHRRENLLSPPSGDTLPRVFFFICAFLFSISTNAELISEISHVRGKCHSELNDYAYHKSKVVCVMNISCEARPRLNQKMVAIGKFKGKACCQTNRFGQCPDADVCIQDSSMTNKECSSLKKLGYCPTRPSSLPKSSSGEGAQ